MGWAGGWAGREGRWGGAAGWGEEGGARRCGWGEGVRLLLQPLVGVVDAQLLERVGDEALEAEDVEDAW